MVKPRIPTPPHPLPQHEVQLRRSKYGLVMVLRSSKQAGGLKVGFRIDPEDRLRKVAKRIERIHRAWHSHPLYGVDFTLEDRVRNGGKLEYGLWTLPPSQATTPWRTRRRTTTWRLWRSTART